jgi:hypothetical protein
MRSLLFGFSLFSISAYSTTAVAEDMDFDSEEKKEKKTRASKKVDIDRNVREIERGLYSKANVGAMINVLGHSSVTRPVHSLALSVGNDFMDRESMSMAWEVSFLQTVHNGDLAETQPGLILESDYFQGDTRGFGLLAAYEISKYPTRRIGIGFRVVAGVMGMPLLMDEEAYNANIVSSAWGLTASPNHNKVYIPVGGGPTIEYYTKLAHFSVGLDTDVLYIIGWDLGINPMGYMKYTF